jgi:hypothetical protein
MIPWGADQAWERHPAFDGPSRGVLYGRCLGDVSCAAAYREAVADAATAIEALDLGSRATELAALLAPWEDLEPPRELAEHSRAEIDESVAATAKFIDARPAEAAAWLKPHGEPPTDEHKHPDPPPDQGAPPPDPPRPATLRASGARVSGRAIASRVVPSGAGAISPRGTALATGRARVACQTGAEASGATGVPLRCRLSGWALRMLASRSLAVALRTCLAPEDGSPPVCAATRVVVPRRVPG